MKKAITPMDMIAIIIIPLLGIGFIFEPGNPLLYPCAVSAL